MFRQFFLSCLLIVSSLSGVVTTPILRDTYLDENEDYVCDDSPYATCKDNEREIINKRETYTFVISEKIDSVKFNGDIRVSHYRIRNNEITTTLTHFIDGGDMTFHFYYQKEYVCSYALYFALSEEGTFYSSGRSLDCAKSLAGQELGYIFLANDEEAEEQLIEEDEEDEEVSYGIGAHGNVYGYFRWTDDEGEVHPLQGAEVTLRIGGSWYKDTTYTDEDGYYSFEYQHVWYLGSGKPRIILKLRNERMKVVSHSVYAYKFKLADKDTTIECTRTFSIDQDGDFGKAACIYQGAYLFSNVAYDHDLDNIMKRCRLQFPANRDLMCYTDYNKTIRIPNRITEYTPNIYMSWDSIGHEYLHHIQNCHHMLVGVSAEHYSYKNDIDTLIEREGIKPKKVKTNAMILSFQEAFATYWSISAQQFFHYQWWYIPTVGDTSYVSYNGVDFDLDIYYDPRCANLGDCQERAIMRILYKLESNTLDTYDRFALGFDTLWDIFYNYEPLTFNDYVNGLYNEGIDKLNLGKLFGQYGVTPETMDIEDNSYDTCPTYTWSTFMGNKYLYYNEFDFVVLNNEQEELFGHTITTEEGAETASYTLSEEEWQLIQENTTTLYYIYIVAWQTDYFLSGGYYSDLYTFYLPRSGLITPLPSLGDAIVGGGGIIFTPHGPLGGTLEDDEVVLEDDDEDDETTLLPVYPGLKDVVLEGDLIEGGWIIHDPTEIEREFIVDGGLLENKTITKILRS